MSCGIGSRFFFFGVLASHGSWVLLKREVRAQGGILSQLDGQRELGRYESTH